MSGLHPAHRLKLRHSRHAGSWSLISCSHLSQRMTVSKFSAASVLCRQLQDHLAIALARPAHGRETVDHGGGAAKKALTPASGSGSKPMEPSGSVASIASKAAAVMAMRAIYRLEP